MSEYTYADVIIDPNDERVKAGEKYYFANSEGIVPLTLEGIKSDGNRLCELVDKIKSC